jgi:hypothetical protein
MSVGIRRPTLFLVAYIYFEPSTPSQYCSQTNDLVHHYFYYNAGPSRITTLRQTASHQWRAKRYVEPTEGVENFVRLFMGTGAAVAAMDHWMLVIAHLNEPNSVIRTGYLTFSPHCCLSVVALM